MAKGIAENNTDLSQQFVKADSWGRAVEAYEQEAEKEIKESHN